MNTPREVDINALDSILDMGAEGILADTGPAQDTLADFILRYVILIANKDKLVRDVKESQMEGHEFDPKLQRQNKFKCPFCVLTEVDMAFVWMQIKNHCHEWRYHKLKVIGSSVKEGERDSIRSKYTSNKGGRKNKGSVLSAEGLILYQRVEAFVEQLKAHDNYDVFQRMCNRKAKDYGLIEEIEDIPELPPPKVVKDASDDDVVSIAVPTFANHKRKIQELNGSTAGV
jgi:hypothetical protein